jgi:hypothetical protein
MKVERKDIIKNLVKKGFVKDDNGHHIYFYHQVNGKNTGPYTYVSHDKNKTKTFSNVTQIRKQLELDSNREAVELIDCRMDGATYQAILRRKGFTLD